MAVNLSALAGAGQQFFDNSGNPLSGGKLWSYAAGTTTPQTTYTTVVGNVAHANPIILDAAGRVATGEIWLTAGSNYKFVLMTSADVPLATWDNITGINGTGITSNASNVVYDPAGVGAVATTVEDKLREYVSVKDFGAVGDGSANDTAAIQAAIDAHDNVYFPEGTYKVTSTITINANNKNLSGAGIGVSIISNYGTGLALEIASLGGANPTPLATTVSDIEIDGRNVGRCLRLYDVAQMRFSRVKCHRSTLEGVRAEQAIDCSFIDCVSINNATDGFLLTEGTKAGVEFNTNAVQVFGCVAYGNTAAGLRIVRSRGNIIVGGEYSANGYNVWMQGGERNSLIGLWMENATTRGLLIESSTSGLGVLYSGSQNRITDCIISGPGVGTIQVANGDSNFFQANYIGINMTVDVTATRTYIGQQAGLIGTITDNGSGTINLSNYTAQYYKVSGAKRLQLDIGTNVDFTSDIQALRFGQIKGLSSTTVLANNFTNFVDITGAATTATVTFGTAETSAAYGVVFGVWHVAGTPASGSEAVYMTSRATTGFTINLRAAPGVGNTVRVQWMLVR